MKLVKTDHGEQSLSIDIETSRVIREACETMIKHRAGSVEMRDKAMKLRTLLTDPDRNDSPAIFQRSHGIIINCPDCAGTRTKRSEPENRNDEIEFTPCKTCKGEGQLYQEIIRKMYVPNEYHRRKLAK
jgi:hypothetical protein